VGLGLVVDAQPRIKDQPATAIAYCLDDQRREMLQQHVKITFG
jgi:hypothetical protein